MKLLGTQKKDVDKDKNGEGVPKLEPIKVALVHCNLVNNSYQLASKLLFTFVPNTQFGQLITISLHSLTMLKTTNTEFGDKYGKNLMDTATKQEYMLQKLLLNELLKKTAEATGGFIRNKIADKITSSGKTKSKEKEEGGQEISISPEKDKKLLMT